MPRNPNKTPVTVQMDAKRLAIVDDLIRKDSPTRPGVLLKIFDEWAISKGHQVPAASGRDVSKRRHIQAQRVKVKSVQAHDTGERPSRRRAQDQ